MSSLYLFQRFYLYSILVGILNKMANCSEIIVIINLFVKSTIRAYNQSHSFFAPSEVEIQDENVYIQCFENHHFNRLCDLFTARISEIREYLDTRELPRSAQYMLHAFIRMFDYLRTDAISAVRHYCSPDCSHYEQVPIAEVQGISWSSTLPFVPEQDSDSDSDIEVLNFHALNISEPLNDPAPTYDYPPAYFLAVSETTLPTTLIRYGLEVFEVLWDLLLNFAPNVSTTRYDMLDFVSVQTQRDLILQAVGEDLTYDQYVDVLRQLENLQDLVFWYGKRREEEYFRRHNSEYTDTYFVHHVSCPACLTQMFHCYKEVDYHNICANPEKCEREKMLQYFEPQLTLPYSVLFHLLQQRKIFGIKAVFDYYARPGQYGKFETFLSNIEVNMLSAGYTSHDSTSIAHGERLDLTFTPQSLCKLDPDLYHDIYVTFFKKFIQNQDQDNYARFLSIALSGSLRHARLYRVTPRHLRAQLWDGKISWQFVEPYSRTTEPLFSRFILDSIFENYRSGLTWQLKPQFDKAYDDYRKLQNTWKQEPDGEAFSFLSLLNR